MNPPYIPTKEIDNLSREVRFFEPRLALDGVDGLNCWRQILPKIVAILKPSSTVFAEIGNGQEEAVSEIARSAICRFLEFNDLSGVGCLW